MKNTSDRDRSGWFSTEIKTRHHTIQSQTGTAESESTVLVLVRVVAPKIMCDSDSGLKSESIFTWDFITPGHLVRCNLTGNEAYKRVCIAEAVSCIVIEAQKDCY